ncbi:MAG: NUDIX hydrolase [Lachnospiraceae bacterium]|nr:NUDIX hydrolase [Lachnospiraceae bacterium]
MPSFLEDYSAFSGDGSNNEDNLSLDEFLESYDPLKYRSPSVTADILLLCHNGPIETVKSGMSLLMVRRRNHPCIGYWALPGGFCEIGEDLEDTARRELEEETGLTGIVLEQLYTWGEVWRDPRDRIITTSYIAVVDKEPNVVAGDDAAEAGWFNISMSQKVMNEDEKEKNTLYTIELTSKDNGEKLTGSVLVKESKNSLFVNRRYEVVESNKIAFDHARFIVNGLIYIEDCIRQK